MSAPTNIYRVIDASSNVAGQPSTPGGGTSGAPLCADYTAPSPAAAITIAHIICSALQRPGQVVQVIGGSPPWTQIQGAAANVALTAVPSGTGY